MFIYHLCYESFPHNVFSNLDYDTLWYTDILTIYVTKAFKIFCKLRPSLSLNYICVWVYLFVHLILELNCIHVGW